MHHAFARRGRALLLVTVLTLLTAGCNKLLEIPSSDPHSPVISNAAVLTPVVPVGGQLVFAFDYYDAGGDVEIGKARDKQSGTTYEATITLEDDMVVNPFPGTSGRTVGSVDAVSGSQAGPHTLLIWVLDSNGSRSNKLEITFTLVT